MQQKQITTQRLSLAACLTMPHLPRHSTNRVHTLHCVSRSALWSLHRALRKKTMLAKLQATAARKTGQCLTLTS